MDSSLGPLLADIFMANLEAFQLSRQINGLRYYERYVDDIFAIVPEVNDVSVPLENVNQAHPTIKFTMEEEKCGSLPFLDVFLSIRPDGSTRRSVYREKTWSGQYTSFEIFVALNMKRNLARFLTKRVRNIYSTDSIGEPLKIVENLFRQNGYPDRCKAKYMTEGPPKLPMLAAKKEDDFHQGPISTGCAKRTSKKTPHSSGILTFPAADGRVLFSTSPILRAEGKEKLPGQTTLMCIYSFTCSCGAEYIGRRSRRLSKRIREQLPARLGEDQIKSVSSFDSNISV
nr:unnamed protein product [Spirometra erinaceieuropaei]